MRLFPRHAPRLNLIDSVSPVEELLQARRRDRWRRPKGIFYIVIGYILAIILSVNFAVVTLGFKPITFQHYAIQILLLAATILCFWCGINRVAPKKKLVLFLRRFARPDIARAVTYPITTRLFRRFRLLTLQDQSVQPLSSPLRSLLLPSFAASIPLTIVVVLLAYILLFRSPKPGEFDLIDLAYLVNFIFLCFASVPPLVVFLLFIIAIFCLRLRSNARMSITIDTVTALNTIRKEARSLKKWYRTLAIASPRCTVIKCTDNIWMEVVKNLAGECDVIVVGISEPSINLVTEINLLIDSYPEKLVFVGQKTELELREQLSSAIADVSDTQTSLVSALNGRPVLTYDDPVSPEFTYNLATLIENRCSQIDFSSNVSNQK